MVKTKWNPKSARKKGTSLSKETKLKIGNANRLPKIKKKCNECGGLILLIPSRSGSKFCSRECYYKNKTFNKIIKKCKYCGKIITLYGTNKNTIYCSKVCSEKDKILKICVSCKWCGELIEKQASRVKLNNFCSKKCRNKSYLGKNNPQWCGGISFAPYTVDWTETLRKSIRERDHYTCQICSNHGNQVHHIDYIKENCNPINLISLCKPCHSKTNSNRKYWEKLLKQKMLENKQN